MIAHSWIKPLLISGILVLPALALAQSIQAYTLTNMPFTNTVNGVTPCYVDQAQQALNKIVAETKGSTPQTALSQISPQDLQTLSDSMTCAYQAALMGVQKIPAVVVDQKYVVYGNTDMAGSIAEIQDAESNS